MSPGITTDIGSDVAPDIVIRIENHVGRITLNRPRTLHSLTLTMFQQMLDAVKRWRDDPEVHAVMVDHAEGTRGFCSGGDINLFLDAGSGDPTPARNLFRVEYALNAAIATCPKPYIGFLDGITMGGGAGITIHGTHRIATENTVFAMPETAIGLFPDIGAGFFLPKMPGEIGTWLGLTGARIRASDVVAIGVGTHNVPAARMGELKQRLLAGNYDADAYQRVNRILRGFGLPIPPPDYQANLPAINRCYGYDRIENIIAALERESSDWADQQLTLLLAKSPLSVKIALRMIREGAKRRSMDEEMKTEFRIVWRRITDTDLAEGVRSVVVDRDYSPQWSPASIDAVTEAMVDEYFQPLGADELLV